jgi:sugar phosphate isomerase/epimerase
MMNFNRRQFITTSAAAGTGFLISSLTAFSKPIMPESQSGYSLLIFATNWGFSGSWDEFASKIKQAGYDGMEVWWPGDEKNQNELFEALTKHKLQVGFLVGSGEKNFQKHLSQFQRNLSAAAKAKPVYINCHSGKDFFSFEQSKQFMDLTEQVNKETGVPIYHESHRGRILFAATIARHFIEKVPGLRLTLDISHWCNVHESYLSDQEETIAMALSRTDHIHARIGHPEGPQVNDPRAPEWRDAVAAHFNWWDKVVETKKKEGKRMTFLTEFGPADYMPTLPYTRQAVADQWEINVHMMDVLRKRYA